MRRMHLVQMSITFPEPSQRITLGFTGRRRSYFLKFIVGATQKPFYGPAYICIDILDL